jgi:hypothetical protein
VYASYLGGSESDQALALARQHLRWERHHLCTFRCATHSSPQSSTRLLYVPTIGLHPGGRVKLRKRRISHRARPGGGLIVVVDLSRRRFSSGADARCRGECLRNRRIGCSGRFAVRLLGPCVEAGSWEPLVGYARKLDPEVRIVFARSTASGRPGDRFRPRIECLIHSGGGRLATSHTVRRVSVPVGGIPAPILRVASPARACSKSTSRCRSRGTSNAVEIRYQDSCVFSLPAYAGPGVFLLSDGTPAVEHTWSGDAIESGTPR